MAKKNLDGALANLFGEEPKPVEQVPTPAEPQPKADSPRVMGQPRRQSTLKVERTGKPKVLPDNYTRTNYIMDPEIIRKFKAIATLRGVSVNLLANDVIGAYVEKNFAKDTQ